MATHPCFSVCYYEYIEYSLCRSGVPGLPTSESKAGSRMKTTTFAVLLLLATTHLFGQSAKRASASAMSTITGRVFLVTESGDLKVARLAHVYFVFGGNLRQGESVNTAEWKFLSVLVSEEQQLSIQAKDDTWNPSAAAILRMYSPPTDTTDAEARQVCLKRRLQYITALDETSKWVDQNKKHQQLQSTDTDEQGMFAIKLPVGIYEIVSSGQAGINEAIWTKEDVIVPPRQTVSLKLSSPEVSCLVSN